jgi:RNA polymerase primary sigma factor
MPRGSKVRAGYDKLNAQKRLAESEKALQEYISQYEQEAGGHELLSREQELYLGKAIKAGDKDAWRTLVEHNYRLVISIVRSNIRQKDHIGSVAYLDLIQEGNIGLMRAASKYDPKRNNRFSTMATWWIRQAVGRAIDEMASAIHQPVYVKTALRKCHRLDAVWQAGHAGRSATDAELAGLAVSPRDIGLYRDYQAGRISSEPMSLETPVGADASWSNPDAMHLSDTLEAADGWGSIETIDRELEGSELIQWCRAQLTPREWYILEVRTGLNGYGLTLEQTGRMLKLTRERIRQVEGKAKRKLIAAGLKADGSYPATPRTKPAKKRSA